MRIRARSLCSALGLAALSTAPGLASGQVPAFDRANWVTVDRNERTLANIFIDTATVTANGSHHYRFWLFAVYDSARAWHGDTLLAAKAEDRVVDCESFAAKGLRSAAFDSNLTLLELDTLEGAATDTWVKLPKGSGGEYIIGESCRILEGGEWHRSLPSGP
jgi:hypothetical protein